MRDIRKRIKLISYFLLGLLPLCVLLIWFKYFYVAIFCVLVFFGLSNLWYKCMIENLIVNKLDTNGGSLEISEIEKMLSKKVLPALKRLNKNQIVNIESNKVNLIKGRESNAFKRK